MENQNYPIEQQNAGERALGAIHESPAALHAGKRELVSVQKQETKRLKSGGPSGITGEFGKPDLVGQVAHNESRQLIAQAAPEQTAPRDVHSATITKDQGVEGVVLPGHSIKFSVDKNGLHWATQGNWTPEEWSAQQSMLKSYLTGTPDAAQKLAAELRKHGGGMTLSGEVSEAPPPPKHETAQQQSTRVEATDRFQQLAGQGYVNGRKVIIGGGANDIRLSANAPDGTPVVVGTADGQEQISGQIATVKGHKYFVPEQSVDLAGNRRQIENQQANSVQLSVQGAASYAPDARY